MTVSNETRAGVNVHLPTAEAEHRIKNNLALVAALLGAQARGAGDDRLADGLNDARARVLAISALHETLSVKGGSVVILSDYLRTVCDQIRESGLMPPNVALLLDDLENGLAVTSPTASRIGVVVAELITNAVRHAFPDGRGGSIRVELARMGETVELRVCDDGVGRSDCVPSGTGSAILEELVRKLEGHLSIEDQEGCQARLVLPTAITATRS